MLFNIVFGLIIPWIIGIYLYRKSSNLFIVIYPFGCTVAFIFNTLGLYFGFWSINPLKFNHINALITNLGAFPIIGTLFVYLVHKTTYNNIILIIIFTISTTMIEFILILFKRAVYGSGWNLFYTFISYLTAYTLGYIFYHFVTNKKIIG